MNSTITKSKGPSLMPTLAKSAIVGAVGGMAGSYLFGGGTLPLMGMDVSVPVALGTAIGAPPSWANTPLATYCRCSPSLPAP